MRQWHKIAPQKTSPAPKRKVARNASFIAALSGWTSWCHTGVSFTASSPPAASATGKERLRLRASCWILYRHSAVAKPIFGLLLWLIIAVIFLRRHLHHFTKMFHCHIYFAVTFIPPPKPTWGIDWRLRYGGPGAEEWCLWLHFEVRLFLMITAAGLSLLMTLKHLLCVKSGHRQKCSIIMLSSNIMWWYLFFIQKKLAFSNILLLLWLLSLWWWWW